MKLLDFFTGAETWGEFWRLLGQLGDDSRFAKSQENDEELAQRMVARALLTAEDEDPEWKPAPENWTLLHELLAQIRDRQGDIAALLADLPTPVKKRSEPPAQFPRPETALSRARARVRAERERSYDDKIHDFAERAKDRWRSMSDEERAEMSRPKLVQGE